MKKDLFCFVVYKYVIYYYIFICYYFITLLMRSVVFEQIITVLSYFVLFNEILTCVNLPSYILGTKFLIFLIL